MKKIMKGLCIDIKDGGMGDVLRTIGQIGGYCDAIKINLQAFLGFTPEDHKKVTETIRGHGKYAIIDAKLGDIGHSNNKAFRFYEECGYDALTFNPYSFNITRAVQNTVLDLYVLVLMSNPEASRFQKRQGTDGKVNYQIIAEECVEAGAYGVVVGATVKPEDYEDIRRIVGKNTSILHPGVGAQGGDLRENCLNVVGRSITNVENIRKQAELYYEKTRY